MAQPASTAADGWLGDDPDLVLWTLTPVEIASAVWRLVREGRLSEADALAADLRSQELAASAHTVVDVEQVSTLARRLLRVHPLRAADALQLGAALVWATGRPSGHTLHTLDDRLATAARREGFRVP